MERRPGVRPHSGGRRRDIWLAALCAGPILLGRWGLLDGHKAVSYPTRQDQLGRAQVLPEARAVLDGKFVTGHACGSSFDFGLKIVEALPGPGGGGDHQ